LRRRHSGQGNCKQEKKGADRERTSSRATTSDEQKAGRQHGSHLIGQTLKTQERSLIENYTPENGVMSTE